jgi:hypothetical protein
VTYYAWVWGLPVAGVATVLAWVATLLGSQLVWVKTMAALSGFGIWFLAVIPLSRMLTMRRAWKRLLPPRTRKARKAMVAVELEFDETQVISRLPGRNEGRFFWPAIVDYAEDEKLALIFVAPKRFLFVPRRAMPDEAWVQLRGYVAARGLR